MAIKAVLFDWDGTLYDILDFLVKTYQEVMQEVGVPVWSKEDFNKRFHSDWRSMLPEMGLEDHEGHLIQRWDERQEKEKQKLKLYSGVVSVIEKLENDFILGIVTSAPRKKVIDELERNNIRESFKAIVAYEDCENHKPEPEPLLLAAEKLGIPPKECVYVGDMSDDIQAAKKAGMASIAVTWGLHPKQILVEENPDYLADDLPALLRIISELNV
ncbi:HAD family hydrolase [Candidatus Altiarchaeota archaeon]